MLTLYLVYLDFLSLFSLDATWQHDALAVAAAVADERRRRAGHRAVQQGVTAEVGDGYPAFRAGFHQGELYHVFFE